MTVIIYSVEPQRNSLAAYATMVGALVLARAVDDEVLSAEMRKAAAASIDAA